MYTTNGQNGAISIIRKMSVSVLFLVGAIGYSVYVLFGLVGSLAGDRGHGSYGSDHGDERGIQQS